MDYRKKIETFVDELNAILADQILFPPNGKDGYFEVNIKETPARASIELTFRDRELTHRIVYNEVEMTENYTLDHFYALAYWQIFRFAFCAKDSISFKEGSVSVLSFNTLIDSGLEKLIPVTITHKDLEDLGYEKISVTSPYSKYKFGGDYMNDKLTIISMNIPGSCLISNLTPNDNNYTHNRLFGGSLKTKEALISKLKELGL